MDRYELLKKWALNIKGDGITSDDWKQVVAWSEQRQVDPNMQKLKYTKTQYYIIVGSAIIITLVVAYVLYSINYKPPISIEDETDETEDTEIVVEV